MSEQSSGSDDLTEEQRLAEMRWEQMHDAWTAGGMHGPEPEFPGRKEENQIPDVNTLPETDPLITEEVNAGVIEDDTPVGPPSEEDKAKVRSMLEDTRRKLRNRDGISTQPPVDGPDDENSAE